MSKEGICDLCGEPGVVFQTVWPLRGHFCGPCIYDGEEPGAQSALAELAQRVGSPLAAKVA